VNDIAPVEYLKIVRSAYDDEDANSWLGMVRDQYPLMDSIDYVEMVGKGFKDFGPERFFGLVKEQFEGLDKDQYFEMMWKQFPKEEIRVLLDVINGKKKKDVKKAGREKKLSSEELG
jgi:hypothetical protein